MTATLHRLGTGRDAGLYYTNDPNKETHNRDEYYASNGAGVWHSSGQTIVADGAAVTVETFRDLCAGVDPRSGQALVRGSGEDHRAGVDVTFTAGKSVSILWMAGDAEQRKRIEAAHRKAVTRALTFLQDEGLVVVRHGAGGLHRAKPADLIVGRFDHFTTRAGDPNIHSHCIVMNVAGNPGTSERYASKHLTTETDELFKAQLMVGAAYRSALAEQLTMLGFEFRPAGQGQFEIVGLPQNLLEVFSKRSHEIEDLVGRSASAAQKEVAALRTRTAKVNVLTGAALEANWQRELAETNLDPWLLARTSEAEQTRERLDVIHDQFTEPSAVVGTGPTALAASNLFLTENVLDRQRLLERALVEASLKGLGPDAVYSELAQLEAAGTLLRLDATHWTTSKIAATEAEMIRAADRPAERDWISSEVLAKALGTVPHLSVEQTEAVQVACNSDGVSLIEAGAGTGKTTLSNAVVAAAKFSGMDVIGLAPSWVAADQLSGSTGISAQAIAKWRFDFVNGMTSQLNANTMIVVDEVGMVGTGDMAIILGAARAAGAKVVLMGDRRQLQSVSGASALTAIADVLEKTAILNNVRRQKIDWQRAASALMARGNSEAGLRVYARHGQLELVNGEEVARAMVIAKWTEARQQHGDDVLIVTRRNIDAIALNAEARLALRHEGVLAIKEAAMPSIGRDDKPRDLAISVGDKVRFGETVSQHGIRNGSRAVIEFVGAVAGLNTELKFRLENGDLIRSTWGDLSRKIPGRKPTLPRISHSYAGTAHSAQGRTAAAAILHIGRKTDAREIYVGLTRHQHEMHVVVEADRLEAACRQRQEDSRVRPTKTAILERLFAEAGQHREKANVVDYVADRASFVATGNVNFRGPDQRWSIRSVLQATMQLFQIARTVQQSWKAMNRVRSHEARQLPLPDHLAALRQRVLRNEHAQKPDRERLTIER